MADINFDCPHCLQNMDAPAEMAGEVIECPSCSREIRIPVASSTHGQEQQDSGSSSPDTGLKCPECEADVAEGAVICINCGLNLKTGRKVPTKM